MCAITKPMLAGKCEAPEMLKFPVLATPKLDGIRCLKIGGRALTRSFKPVSNGFIRAWIEANLPDGVDGELVVPGATFSETSGHVGRESGEPDFRFAVFDYVSGGSDRPYSCRMAQLEHLPEWERVVKVLPFEIRDAAQAVLCR
jgi:DNA ligase-1